MRSTSYEHPIRSAHAAGWDRAVKWIGAAICGVLLMLASANTASAAALISGHPPADGLSAAATGVIDSTPAPGSVQFLERGRAPHSSNQSSSDPFEALLDEDADEDDDDDRSSASVASGACDLTLEHTLSGRCPSRAREGSLTVDGPYPASIFLIESVRRM